MKSHRFLPEIIVKYLQSLYLLNKRLINNVIVLGDHLEATDIRNMNVPLFL
jgi:hypothetical protein